MGLNVNSLAFLSHHNYFHLSIAALYAISNLLCLILYGWDKYAAIRGQQRISERRLLLWTVISGGIIAFIAQRCLRHKTKKSMFQWAAISAFLLHLGAWYFVLIL